MNDFAVSSAAGDLISRMVADRVFATAKASFDDYHQLLNDDALRTLLATVCASYDNYQLNIADERVYMREEFVASLAQVIHRSGRGSEFVTASTALALAFHPATRLLFIEWASTARADLDALFADAPYAKVATPIDYAPRVDGCIGHLVLRDVYWGRGADEHIECFVAAGVAPFFASWHTGAALRLSLASLEISKPKLPFTSHMATAARARLLRRANVTLCGSFFDADPDCATPPSLCDTTLVVRALGLSVLGPRQCAHYLVGGMRAGPVGRIETIYAAEELLMILEPLRLAVHVLLEIAQMAFGLSDRDGAVFVNNCIRVYRRAREIRNNRSPTLSKNEQTRRARIGFGCATSAAIAAPD